MDSWFVTSSDSDDLGSLNPGGDDKVGLSRLVTSSLDPITMLGFLNTFCDTNSFSVFFLCFSNVFCFDGTCVFSLCFSSSLKRVWLVSRLFSNNIWPMCLNLLRLKLISSLFDFSYFSPEKDLFLKSCLFSQSRREFSRLIPTL